MLLRCLMAVLGALLGTRAVSAQTLTAGLDVRGYAVERESHGLAAGAGVGALLSHGITEHTAVLFGVDVGIAQFASRVYRLVGHADLAGRVMQPVSSRATVFGEVAFSSQGLEEPERAENFRTGLTVGAGVDVRRSARRSVELGVRRSWFGASEDWRVGIGVRVTGGGF